jgi:hypothetical protein
VVTPTVEVVPGDLMELKAGDTIPADIRWVYLVAFAPFNLITAHHIISLSPFCFLCPITFRHYCLYDCSC